MNHRTLLPIILLLGTVLAAFGCLGTSDPVAPSSNDSLTPAQTGDINSNRMLWGWWDVSIDSATGEVEIVPVRGPSFNANVMTFLHPPFSPVNQMEIVILGTSDLNAGYVDVDITFHILSRE